jgi:ketosteroid isomerase-like protein
MTFRATATTAALSAALVVAGCGGGPSANDQITSAVTDYYKAFAAGDGAKACDQLTNEAKQQLQTSTRASSCPVAIARAKSRPDIKRYTARFKDAKVAGVSRSGDTATARVRALGVTAAVPLRKEGDAWKIEIAKK